MSTTHIVKIKTNYSVVETDQIDETTYIPKIGEFVYYSDGKFKVGDGNNTPLIDLPYGGGGADLSTGLTYSEGAVALGIDCKAGQKAFALNLPLDKIDANENKYAYFPPDWVNGPYYEISWDIYDDLSLDEYSTALVALKEAVRAADDADKPLKYSVRLTEHRYNYATITHVDLFRYQNQEDLPYSRAKIYVDNLYYTNTVENVPYIWILDKPDLGVDTLGSGAFTAGVNNEAHGIGSVAMGRDNNAYGWYATAIGSGNKVSYGGIGLGEDNKVLGTSAVATGDSNTAEQYADFVSGARNFVSGPGAIGVGVDLVVRGRTAAGFGTTSADKQYAKWSQDEAKTEFLTKSSGATLAAEHTKLVYNSDAVKTQAALITDSNTGTFAAVVAEGGFMTGKDNLVIGEFSNAHGYANVVKGGRCTALGKRNIVSSDCGFASGQLNIIEGAFAHALGTGNRIVGENATAFGKYNEVRGAASTTIGKYSVVSGNMSLAAGEGLIASTDSQIVVGKYNSNNGQTRFEVGGGSSNDSRVTVFAVYDSGRVSAGSRLSIKEDINNNSPDATEAVWANYEGKLWAKTKIACSGLTQTNNLQVDGSTTMKGAVTINGAVNLNSTLSIGGIVLDLTNKWTPDSNGY